MDGNTVAATPREHVRPSPKATSTSKNALKPLIREILTERQPGLLPDEIFDQLLRHHENRMRDHSIENTKHKVRVTLKEMHDANEVERVTATGAKGGSTYAYTLPGVGEATESPCSEMVPGQAAAGPAGLRTMDPSTHASSETQGGVPCLRSQEDGIRADAGETSTSQRRRSEDAERDTQTAQDSNVHSRDSDATSERCNAPTLSEEISPEASRQVRDDHARESLVQLGQKVLRLRTLKDESEQIIRKIIEQKAQRESDQQRCTALEGEAREKRGRGAALDAEAQRLREQLSLVERQIAGVDMEASGLDAELEETKNKCAQLETAMAQDDEKSAEIERERSALKEALGIE